VKPRLHRDPDTAPLPLTSNSKHTHSCRTVALECDTRTYGQAECLLHGQRMASGTSAGGGAACPQRPTVSTVTVTQSDVKHTREAHNIAEQCTHLRARFTACRHERDCVDPSCTHTNTYTCLRTQPCTHPRLHECTCMSEECKALSLAPTHLEVSKVLVAGTEVVNRHGHPHRRCRGQRARREQQLPDWIGGRHGCGDE